MSAAVQVPFRLALRLDELVLAARLADLPLPVRTDGGVSDRLTDRLAGTTAGAAREALDAALARVDDDGPDGARASLGAQDLLSDGDTVDPGVVAALSVLAAGELGGLLDVAVVRAEGDLRLRSWFGVSSSTVAQLSTTDGLDFELAWFAPELWVSQMARAVTVRPWVRQPAPFALPDYVSLPSELLAGSEKAHRERRHDLVPAMAAAYAGRVRVGDADETRAADADDVLRLLSTLGTATRGRLRLVLHRRDREGADPAVASWLLFDDGWHELRPGRDATAVLRRRDARDLGLFSWPAVRSVAEVAS